MIISATLSKPTAGTEALLGGAYKRIKIKLLTASTAQADGARYAVELYTQTQAFHKKFSAEECAAFLDAHAGKTFRACVIRTEHEETTILANKRGKLTRLTKPIAAQMPTPAHFKHIAPLTGTSAAESAVGSGAHNRTKNYILQEGAPVPFLVHLGIMTAQGKVVAAKYDKFRQINRFLEYIDDVLESVLALRKASGREVSAQAPLRIVDFGSGKSYLTFAVHYFLTELRALPCDITGLDLKADVIAYCTRLAADLGTTGLHFAVGDIACYGETAAPDIVITLHACDTATDYALDYAIKRGAAAILSVPCCQHELNAQLAYKKSPLREVPPKAAFAALLKHGILKERFAALATDALRAEYLEAAGYRVQVLEFIDMSHTPKNLLLRAVRRQTAVSASAENAATEAKKSALSEAASLTTALGVTQTLQQLLAKSHGGCF